ncbi:MAG: CubicO group peptidase (beta-lactamase class C family) [Gammaproteobacteria bacterium]|jgi:CubicO group peptidase (beta-lactamase class C family)
MNTYRFRLVAKAFAALLVLAGCNSDTTTTALTSKVKNTELNEVYRSTSSPEQVLLQHQQLPTDEIWWKVNGEGMAWNFKNLHQILPTVNVYRNGPVRELDYAINPKIPNFELDTPDGKMSFEEFIHSEQSTVMGVVILHKGKIAYENYPRMEAYEMPVYWSVAKSFVGTVIRIMEERGEINVSLPIDHYLPEIAESVLAGTSVRDILDMASGLDCADEYDDRDSCYYRYSMGLGDGFRTADAPVNAYEFVKTLKATRLDKPGVKFSYSGMNTFVLGWLVEKIAGMRFQDVLTKEIWWHIGAESNAAYIAPVQGIPVTHGGFLSRMRDLARMGLLFTPSYGVVSDKKIISDEHIEFLWSGGRAELLTNAGEPDTNISGVKHNIYQWDEIRVNGDYFKGGWAGQGFLVNPQRDVVAVWTGYMKNDYSETPIDPIIRIVLDGVFGATAD